MTRVNLRATLTNFVSPLVRARHTMNVTGGHHVPHAGGVLILAAEPCDWTAVRAYLSRPIVVAISQEGQPRDVALAGAWGDLIVDTFPGIDVHRQAIAALEHGLAVATDLTTMSIGYLQAASRAPVLPLSVTDSRISVGHLVTFAPASANSPSALAIRAEEVRQRVMDHDLFARQRSSGMMRP